MKLLSTALVLGLMCSTAALADGDAMKSNTNAMSGSAMSNTNSMSNSNAMAPKPAKKSMKKKPAKNGMMAQPDAMSGQSNNAMSGSNDNMAAPKPH